MKTLMICIAVVIGMMVLSIWACCKVSGDCAREEERQDGK